MKSERNRKIVKLPQHPGIGIVDKRLMSLKYEEEQLFFLKFRSFYYDLKNY